MNTGPTATAAIQISGQAYVDPTFDIWTSQVVTRYNRSRIHRLTGYTSTTLQFRAIARSGGSYTTLAIVADGVLVASQLVPADDTFHDFTISGLPAGSKTIEIWEPFQARAGSLNSDADSYILATYVTLIYVPTGATMAPHTAGTGIVVGVDSLCDGVADEPLQWNGWCGQLRRAAQAAGQLVGYYDYGSCTWAGDGRTAAEMANDVDRLYTNMGSTTCKLVLLMRPNDWAYWGLSFFGVTAAQLATKYGDFLDALKALRPGLVVDIMNQLPQSTGQPAGETDTLADFETAINGLTSGRAWVTMHAKTAYGLVLPTDFVDNVHPNQGGHDKIWAVVRTFANISL